MPFQSEKQRRYLHANHPEIAKRWERDYADGGITRIPFFKGAQADTKKGKAMSPGTSASGKTRHGGDGPPSVVHKPTGPTAEEIAAAKAKAEAEKRRLEAEARKKHLIDFKNTQKKKSKLKSKWDTPEWDTDIVSVSLEDFKPNKTLDDYYNQLDETDVPLSDWEQKHMEELEKKNQLETIDEIKEKEGISNEKLMYPPPGNLAELTESQKNWIDKELNNLKRGFKEPQHVYETINNPALGKFEKNTFNPFKGPQEPTTPEEFMNYLKEKAPDSNFPTVTAVGAEGGVARKKYYKGSNGILDLDETDGEKISLTAFNPNFDEIPQLTDEEQLQIDSEEKEDGEKRIDLFSETDEGDPLNELLLAEDGVTTLFRAKNGGYAVQGGGPNYLGKQPEVKVPRYWKSSPDHPDTELAYITEPEKQVLIDLNLHGGLEDGKPNTGPNGVISLQGDLGGYDASPGGPNEDKGSDHGHSRFDSGYYGGTTTTTTSDGGDDKPYKDPILDMVDKTKIPGTEEYITEEKTDYIEIPERKSPLDGSIRPKQIVTLEKAKQFAKIDAHVDEITKFGSEFWIAKTIANTIKNKVPFGFLLPTIYPKVDMHGNVIKDHVTGSDLGHFQGEEWDHLWENVKDKDTGGDGPEVPQVVPVHEEIQDYTEMAWEPMSYLDKIRAGQAQRASLQAKGIIQDNETMTLNSGGLANLFRVKNY